MSKVQTLDPLTFPLRESRLIEASAGTGKTYTLALLYIRLVLGHGGPDTAFARPLLPHEILVVTFTEAATKELRERIRARLVEAAERFERDPAVDLNGSQDPLDRLRAGYPATRWLECARRLRIAADWMDEAMISTIHGWCQRMLQEHAFETRGLFKRELVADQGDLIAEILRDYWRVHFYSLQPEEAGAIAAVVASPTVLQGELQGWLRQRDSRLSFQGRPLPVDGLRAALSASIREQGLLEEARRLWRTHQAELEPLLWGLQPHLNGTYYGASRERFQTLLTKLADWSQGGTAPSALPRLAQGAFVFKGPAEVKREPPHPAFQAIAAWQDTLTANAAGPSLKACLLAHAAHWVGRELPRRLRVRAEMGFEDLLRDLEAALTPLDPRSAGAAARLAATIRRQLPVALIDEFQDTDPIQYRIFDRIYGPERLSDGADETAAEPVALILIGDPKQAIYGFRGADIHTYLVARRATLGRHDTLVTNYRSTAGMVAACNRFFGHAERHPRGAFRFRTESEDPIPYHQVEARGRDERLILRGREVPAMTFWTLECTESAIGPEDYRRELAAAAATEIVRWLRQARAGQAGFLDASAPPGTPPRPLQPKDIAILVRKGSEAAAMRAALARRGINSVYLSDRDSVFQTPEARDLLHWLRACATPGDEDLVRAALATNTLALPLEELAELRGDELAWEARLERFRDNQQIWQRQGVLAMLHRLMHESGLPARLLARDGGERSLTNLLHLAEWLQSAAVGLDGEQALIRHLTAHLEVTGEEFIVRLESDAELVQVVTIHKSKGLEYPLVLLPFICSWREIDGRTRQVPYRAANERLLEVAGKEVFGEAWAAADDERLSEDMRLLYVAVTRARHAVWLGIAPLKGGTGNKPRLERSALGYLLDGGQAFADAVAITEALESVRGDSPDIAIVPLPQADETRLPPASNDASLEAARAAPSIRHQPWWIASYSALRIGTIATDRIALGTADPIETDASPRRVTAAAETAAQDTASEEAAAREAAEPLASATRPDSGPDLHGLPRGQAYGTFLHGLLEWAAAQRIQDESGVWREGYAAAAIASGPRRDMLARRCRLRGLTPWITTLETWLGDLLERRWTLSGLPDERGQVPTLALSELAPHQIQVEMELLIESHQVHTTTLDQLAQTHCLPGQARPPIAPERLNGMLKGFIDLVFEHAERYYVLDWKSNWLGPDDSAYTPEAMRAAILHHRYDLQYLLYLLALHRQLSARLPGYQYERDVGGVVYVFLRGSRAPSQGLYMDKPPRVLIERLDQLFAGVSPPQDPRSSR